MNPTLFISAKLLSKHTILLFLQCRYMFRCCCTILRGFVFSAYWFIILLTKTRGINVKILTRKSYALANCCHHYEMTYYINITATSALLLSCMHTHVQMCTHFVCDYRANPFPNFCFMFKQIWQTHTTHTLPQRFTLLPNDGDMCFQNLCYADLSISIASHLRCRSWSLPL
jgi:hypothetical protein